MDVAKTNYSLGAMDIEASFTAMRVLADIIASDVSLLVTFNHAIDGVIQNNPRARGSPKVLEPKWTGPRGRWSGLFNDSSAFWNCGVAG